MKKFLIVLVVIVAIVILFFALGSCSEEGTSDEGSAGGLEYTLPEEHDAYTIMVYMNGSDLETEGAMATSDIVEMVTAAFSKEDINVILQTGGTDQWQMDFIPNDSLVRYRVIDEAMEVLEELPAASMGASTNMADFIT